MRWQHLDLNTWTLFYLGSCRDQCLLLPAPGPDTACCFEQNLEAAPYKTAAVCPLCSHFTNCSSQISKTYWALLEKREQTHKQRSLMDSSVGPPAKIYTHQLWMLSRELLIRMDDKSCRNLYCWLTLSLFPYYEIFIGIYVYIDIIFLI